jgi:MraZ protein
VVDSGQNWWYNFITNRERGYSILMNGKNYTHQLDAKNRMRIPAKFREELGAGYYITVGVGGCLYVYTKEQMEEVKAELSHINRYDEARLKPARFILYNTWQAEEDNQGRILLPENLRKLANIVKNVVIFKGPNCVEIWSEEVWQNY